MNLFSFLSRRGDIDTEKRSALDVVTGTWFPLTGDVDEVNDRNLLAANKEWVYIAIDTVARSVASVRLKVMRYQSNGDDREVFDGPLVKFLEHPGSGFTGKDFVYLNTVYKQIAGNSFWERDKLRQLQPLLPTSVSPIVQAGKLVGYKYSDGTGERVIPVKEMLHDRNIDPSRPYWGVSKLSRIARWVDTSAFSNEFLRRFFLNGATFGGFIETEEETEERIKLIKAGLANQHVGVANAHKLGVLPKGAKYAQSTKNMNEIEMGATDDRYRDKILAGFGVPKTLVGLTTEVNRASAEASEYIFIRYTVKPIVDDLLEFLNVYVAPTLDNSGKYYFDVDEFVPKNVDAELKDREIALKGQQYKTVNEVRAEVGLPPVEGGDTIYGSPNLVPLGSAPETAPEAAPGAGDTPNDVQPKKTYSRAAAGRVRSAIARQSVTKKLSDSIFQTFIGTLETTKNQDEIDHKAFVGRVDRFKGQLETAVRVFNSRQKAQVLKDMNAITKDIVPRDVFDQEKEVSLMMDVVTPILGGLLTEQAIEEFAAQNFDGTFTPTAELVRRTVEVAARRLAKTYNKTTAKLIAKALNDGIDAGEGLGELTKRVQAVYEFSDTVRAKSVAHTETFYIANRANLEAYRESGVVKSVRWYTAEDEHVCPHCGPMDGKSVGVYESFFTKGDSMTGTDGSTIDFKYRTIDVPPLHTNCRCFVRPADISIGE